MTQTRLATNLSERQTYRQVSIQTRQTCNQGRTKTTRRPDRQDKAERQTNGTRRTDKSEQDKCKMDGRQQVEGVRPTEADISIYHGDLGEDHEWRATAFREEMARGTSHPLSFLSPPSLFIALSLSHLCLSPVGCPLESPTASSAEYSSGHATGLVVEL